MKKYFEVTNFVGSEKMLSKIYMYLVELFYQIHCTPSMNFVAIRKDVYSKFKWETWLRGEEHQLNDIVDAIDLR